MGVCGCFSFLEKGQDAAGKPLKPAGAEAAVSCEAPRPEADPEDVASWRVGVQGVTDISPEGDGRLLLREPEGLPKEGCPADGAQVTLKLEILLDKLCQYASESLKTQAGSGDLRLPEELELIIPCLKPGGTFLASCHFGAFGELPDSWQCLSPCCGQKVLIRLELLEAQDLHVATLEGHERLDYARGRKEAGGRFFKRGKYPEALERYSLAAEMLSHRDDIKDNALYSQAQEVRSACELNAAACLLKLEKWREAQQVCDAILRTNPANEKALFRRGKALLALGDGDRALKDLKQVLEVNPGNLEAKQALQQARKESRGTARERNVYAKMLKSES